MCKTIDNQLQIWDHRTGERSLSTLGPISIYIVTHKGDIITAFEGDMIRWDPIKNIKIIICKKGADVNYFNFLYFIKEISDDYIAVGGNNYSRHILIINIKTCSI